MKVSGTHARLTIRKPRRTVSLQIRDSQVTVRIKTPAPQCKPVLVQARW